ncbi:uncharacterized protein LOC108923304 [Scleropages formosus]|uniref:Bucky ball n=1 Tax=Scleropages formosus TaxID=113540 RepID=A0A8C9RTW0_SCLFO|nr:uncharacterized protein LOC108923304 [Scleropages formosus]XP_018589483.1 uncharacterized protein LOC108923304 [Scleropages formosus]
MHALHATRGQARTSNMRGARGHVRIPDVSNLSHSMGSGQPPVSHSRPFFYVQPPSHPYFMCQWQMNSPFGHYGLPVSGMPFGRPYLSPCPYMHYPGYIVPHAPIQPIDYRRMFAPHLLPTISYDVRFGQYCNQQAHVQRETATSEVQTEPSNLVNELLASLGRVQTCMSSTGVEKELESAVVSQTSGGSACSEEVGDCEGSNRELEPLPQRHWPTRELSSKCRPSSRTIQFETSTVFKTGSSQSHLGDLVQPESWPVGPDEEPPIDSSSVHEETVVADAELPQQSCLPERVWFSGMQGDSPGSATPITDGSKAHPDHQTQELEQCNITFRQGVSPSQTNSPGPPPPNSSTSLAVDSVAPDSQRVSKSSQLHPGDRKDLLEKPVFDVENLPYRILQLPCDKMTAAGQLQKGSPLWCVDSAFLPPSSYLSSLGNALYYSYYPQASQERQSVLSPSLEELSSRDELFSTDLEDIDLISGHVYAGGGRWVTSTTRDPLCSEGDGLCSSSQEACCKYQEKMCSVCSSHSSKMAWRRPTHGLGSCDCAEGESDAETEEAGEMLQSVCKHCKTVVGKHKVQRPQQLQGQQSSKQKTKPGTENLTNQEEWEQSILREHQCCKKHRQISKASRSRDLELKHVKSRPCVDKQLCDNHISDQEHWESCSVKPRSRGCKVHPSQGQEKSTRRRVPSKTLKHQRHKRKDLNDETEPPGQKGKGSTKSYKKLI